LGKGCPARQIEALFLSLDSGGFHRAFHRPAGWNVTGFCLLLRGRGLEGNDEEIGE